jgi:hypothetical protein
LEKWRELLNPEARTTLSFNYHWRVEQ